jgi:NAD(P)-dependent dehydrogenase (short-subunit alcohol dehydrogenase family)
MTRVDLAGQVAIVTGASQGLGLVFASALAAAGAHVVLGDVDDTGPACDAIAREGGRVEGRHLDVTQPVSATGLVEDVVGRHGRIDILVNNAAISGRLESVQLAEIESADWDRVMAVNARGVFEMIKAVAPVMRERGRGVVINIASGTAIKGTPGLLRYVASKGAVIAMTRAPARELGDDGIRVNCIAPGLTMTQNTLANPSWSPAARMANIATRALKRDAHPGDLVGALLFLACDASAFVTGQTLAVDGGSVML